MSPAGVWIHRGAILKSYSKSGLLGSAIVIITRDVHFSDDNDTLPVVPLTGPLKGQFIDANNTEDGFTIVYNNPRRE